MFDWSEYLSLANEMVQRPEEAAKRAAVSRAYYSVFCRARNWLEIQGIPIGHNNSDHNTVWTAFERLQGKSAKRIGQEGKRLRRARNMVDYDNTVDKLSSTVRSAMEHAKTIHTELQHML